MFFDVTTFAIAVVCLVVGFVLGATATRKKAINEGLRA